MPIPESEPFLVDLNDHRDLSAKYDEAQVIIDAYEQELARVTAPIKQRIVKWKSFQSFIRTQLQAAEEAGQVVTNSVSAGGSVTVNGSGGSDAVRPGELVVKIVNREKRKIRPREVREILAREGIELDGQAVSNALHYAAHTGKKIQVAPGRGWYAPLDYVEEELPSPTAPSATAPQAQTAEPYSAPSREDWSGARHPAAST